MKKTVLTLWIVIFSTSLFAQIEKELFYYYQGEKIYLKENNDKILIKLSKEANRSNFLKSAETDPNYKVSNPQNSVGDFVILEAKKGILDQSKAQSLSNCQNHSNVACANFMLQYDSTSRQGLTDEFIVKLKLSTTLSELENLCEQYQITRIEKNKFDNQKFTITVAKTSRLSVINLSNLFFETGLFEYSEPNFFRLNIKHTNDPLYNNQWPLGNTTAGINIENAWQITRGRSEIRIAVVDEGVDLNHPDLADNLLNGFDATGNGSGGQPTGNEAHGTACAGIIAAISDNNLGVTGIAPNCRIMPARARFGFGGTDGWLADCINWAWQNDADIISNSWGGGSKSNQITGSVNDATSRGRDSLGCIVLFSTGNDGSSVSYPATLSNVIAVGATSNTGIKESYSNYGSELDVVAPGGNKNIYTTDISGSDGYDGGDYTSSFDGTSAACPHAAGVVGLMLSVNRCLTWQEAKSILELSCDKVGGYCYNSSSSHPNGTWNNQMGHGRINAFKAVQYAHSMEVNSYSNVGGGTDQGTIGFYQWVLSSGGCSNLAAASYFVKRHEIHKTVSFPYTEAPLILGTSNGFSSANPNSGNYWLGYQNLTSTSVTLKTNVYEVTTILGQTVDWVPRHPSYVKFDFTVLSALNTNIYLQNETVTSGTRTHNATNEIFVGRNVTSSKPQGDYVVQGAANVTLRAGNQITFRPGTVISPSQGGSFHASVEPFFTCTQYPMGRMAQKSSTSGNSQDDEDEKIPFIKDYDVSFQKSEITEQANLIELKVYPNPSTHFSTIEYFLPKSSEVELSIYDLKGNELTKLKNRIIHESGNYRINLELNNYPSGIYILKLTTNQGIFSSQLIKQ